MVDFKKMRAAKTQAAVLDPIEIFRRLPKPSGINDLYISQAEVLNAWFERRAEKDVVTKLHTGGGKTLVGLLIAQSTMNELRLPVVYLSPTTQLVDQTVAKSASYSIAAVAYEKGTGFPDDFLSARSVLVCTYQALFNGMSRFGIRGGSKEIVNVGAVVIDDAHVAFSSVRDCFTISVTREDDAEGYAYLGNLFRADFAALGRVGTFDDIMNGIDPGVLEVPYWSWYAHTEEARTYLRTVQESHKFVWPFLRDALVNCHALVSKNAFVITPVLPMVDLVPTFADAQRRIYMSATIGDDSAIVRTFGASSSGVTRPIASKSLAGVSERMILAPELMRLNQSDVGDIVKRVAIWAANKVGEGTVILVPSFITANAWGGVGTVASSAEAVAECIRALQANESRGPFIFANRYDGIDLPGSACRLLIVSGLPRGSGEYDAFRAGVLGSGAAINAEIGQRLEQGIGRGARGPNDYCVVILTGKDVVAWISRSSNLRFLTSSTRAQLEMGLEVSKNVAGPKDLAGTIRKCLERDREWTEYHAETLADLVDGPAAYLDSVRHAATERKAFQLIRDGYFEKAIGVLSRVSDEDASLDSELRGWMKQFAARAAEQWGRPELALKLQQDAYALNRNLLRPKVVAPYEPIVAPGEQSTKIVNRILEFRNRRGYLAHFDEMASHLVPEASANQFEQALADLGEAIGFTSDRPEQSGPGPDVLWLTAAKTGFVIEAKSRKNTGNAFTKDEHGQLLSSAEWFKQTYAGIQCIRVAVHPTATATKNASPGDSLALTLPKLAELISSAREFLAVLCESSLRDADLVVRCERELQKSNLTSEKLIAAFLQPFSI